MSGSILRIPFMRIRRSLSKKWQWRKKWDTDSTAKLHGQRGFKVSLKWWRNLCSRRWLKPRRNQVKYFIPKELDILKILLGDGLIDFKMEERKLVKDSELTMPTSSLFHSLITERKKSYEKIQFDRTNLECNYGF